jgi:hypothetical protein
MEKTAGLTIKGCPTPAIDGHPGNADESVAQNVDDAEVHISRWQRPGRYR